MKNAQRYVMLSNALKKTPLSLDASYQAALYLLAQESWMTEIAKPFIRWREGIDFEAMKKAMPGCEESTMKMINLAQNLFSAASSCSITPYDIAHLGYPYLDWAINAICIAGGEARVQIKEQEGELALAINWSVHNKTISYMRNMQANLSRNFEPLRYEDDEIAENDERAYE